MLGGLFCVKTYYLFPMCTSDLILSTIVYLFQGKNETQWIKIVQIDCFKLLSIVDLFGTMMMIF